MLDTLVPKESQVQASDGRWYNMRVLPYRTADNVIDGVVMTFADTTALKQTRGPVAGGPRVRREHHCHDPRAAGGAGRRAADRLGEPFLLSHVPGQPAETEGRLLYEIGQRQWDIPELRQLLEDILPKNTHVRRLPGGTRFSGRRAQGSSAQCPRESHRKASQESDPAGDGGHHGILGSARTTQGAAMSEKENADSRPSQAADLRQEAERRLHNKNAPPVEGMAEVDVRALLHELQVHQIELEMQNEELLSAQAAVQEVSDKYHDLFDFAPIGYFRLDEQGRILEVNLAGAALLGLDRSTAVKQRFAQHVAIQSRARFAEFLGDVLRADGKQTHEIELQCGEQRRYALLEGMLSQGGEVNRSFHVTATDITERKRLEEADRLLASIVELSEDAIIAKTLSGSILTWNAAAERMYGYAAEEVVGRPISILIPPEQADECRGFSRELPAENGLRLTRPSA